MRELAFVTVNGGVIEMSDNEGTRYSLVVSDAVRTAVRDAGHARVPENELREYRPKDIQQLLRAGVSVEEICERSGLAYSHVERFEGPVVAERAWTIQNALEFAVGHSSDSPALGELVINRLATRNVLDVAWDAVRDGAGPWNVIARYDVAGSEVEARWDVDLSTRTLRALDDESRWLSETDVSSPRSRRHLAASVLYNSDDDGVFDDSADAPSSDTDATDSLLRHLHSSRGQRHSEDDLLTNILDDDDDIPAAHPRPSAVDDTTDALVLPLPLMPEPSEDPPAVQEPTARRPRARRRQSVPSWDEIVFGSDS